MGLKTKRIGIISGLLVFIFILVASASAQLTIPTPPLPPFLDNLTVIPPEIERGDNVTISFTITNIDNQTFGYIAKISVEGIGCMGAQIEDLTILVVVELEAYESKTVSHTITTDTVGDFNVTVHGMTANFKVGTWPTSAPAALNATKFVVSDLSITPEEVEPGDEVTISVLVINIGEETGDYSFSLMIEGNFAIEIIEMVGALGAGESETATHTKTLETPGRYTVTTYGLTGSFMVKAPPKPAEFVLSELEALGRQALVHDDEGRPIVEGEYVIFNVLVENIGETEGTYTVEFKVRRLDRQTLWDEETIDTLNVTLAAGRGRRAFTYYEALNTGTYQVIVGDLTDTFTVRAPLEPAEFVFSNLQITPRVKIGMSVNISVDVTNVGEEMGGCTVELKVNGHVVESVEIPPFGGVYPDFDQVTATQFFELTRSEGTYEVEVDGLTGSFTVIKPEPSFWDKIPGFPYESIIIGLIAVIIIIWRARKF